MRLELSAEWLNKLSPLEITTDDEVAVIYAFQVSNT
jgi:hypothetical protein